ncbi:hypothetical protein QJQ45_027501 [Haematococcus lacustris]|nr:hypothetical protein QJQ45_027501 [Haematococcus lacustris]
MVAAADHLAVIPMAGFVESFNISVAAALVMYEAQQQRLRRTGRHADLTQQQARDLTAALMLRSVREGPTVVRELLTRPPPRWQAPRIKNYLAKQERLMRAEEAALGPSPHSSASSTQDPSLASSSAAGQLEQQQVLGPEQQQASTAPGFLLPDLAATHSFALIRLYSTTIAGTAT